MGRGSGRSPAVSGPAILAAVLEAAVDSPARPVDAAVSDPAAYGVYPLIIFIVYVIVTGGILCSRLRRRYILLVQYWADLQSGHGLRCYGNITRTLVIQACVHPAI